MRRTYIVSYDISSDKRLRKVFRICKNYGDHLQYSVFECDLDRRERTEMEEKLREVVHSDEDQVLWIDLGPVESRGERTITALGQPYIRIDQPCYVV